MGNVALNNDRGLILNRVIELSQQSATIFYWVITFAALVFVLAGLMILITSLTSNREIIITASSITAPKNGFSKLSITVNYVDITNINTQIVQKTKILNIVHRNGKLSIANSILPNKAAFEELVSQLQIKVNG